MDLGGHLLRGKTAISIVDVTITTETVIDVVLTLGWDEVTP